MMHRFEAHIYGRVQMVMFRDFTTRKARGLGLVGQVRNLPDGSVCVIAEGEKSVLDRFVQKLHQGPILAKVEHIELAWKEPSGGYTSFDIVYE